MTSGFIVISVDIPDDADGDVAAQEVFEIVGNEPFAHVEYVLAARWEPSPNDRLRADHGEG